MERFLMNNLIQWKENPQRKPLIINGARQVGKTWLVKEFGRLYYSSVVYINMDNNQIMLQLFDEGYNIDSILEGLSLYSGISIDPASTLIIFDEIQEIPKALTSLKYFDEDERGFSIIAAGSLLGVSMHKDASFPVGKVETLNLYPLSFEEFVLAQKGQSYLEAMQSPDPKMIQTFKSQIIQLLKTYYFVGGMPEAVVSFGDNSDYDGARTVQKRIISDYERDFSKHLDARDTEKVFSVWDSLPAHLSNENKKFIFGRIAKGARAKDYESAITWLTKAGLIYVVPRINKPGIPLKSYKDPGAFKVFVLDVGLLGAMCDLDSKSILAGNDLFEEFKGALTEQYVCQQLISSCAITPYYWSAENSRGEIDFAVQLNGDVYAIEVKAEENLRAKSLRSFKEKYHKVNCIRFSLSDFRIQDWMRNIPLYLVSNTKLWTLQL